MPFTIAYVQNIMSNSFPHLSCKFVTMNGVTDTIQMPVLLNYGGSKNFIADMTPDELKQARQAILQRAREKAFSKGLPIYFSQNNVLLAEYSDGRIEPVANT